MNRITALFIAGLLGSSVSACTLQDLAAAGLVISTPQPGVVVAREPPPLVYVDPDVAVVEDSSVPVYYTDNSYWSERNGSWYHAEYWDAPWNQVDRRDVPGPLWNRDHRAYQHYRGPQNARRWREPREHTRHDQGDRGRGDHGGDRGHDHGDRPGPDPSNPQPIIIGPRY